MDTGEHVLVVAGRESVHDRLAGAIRSDGGSHVTTCGTAAEAVEILADTDAVDCIVSDTDLPDVDGVAFLDVLRIHRPDLALLALIGPGDEHAAKRALRAGVDDCLDRSRLLDEPATVLPAIDGAIAHGHARSALDEGGTAQSAHLAAADDPMAVVRDGAFVAVNDGLLALAGVTDRSALGSPSDRFDLDDAELRTAGFGQGGVDGAGIDRSDRRCRRSDGSTASVVLTTAGISWQGDPATLLIARPAERESPLRPVPARDDRALEQVREEYEQLINGMNDTAWVIDDDGTFLAVNDAAVDRLGYSRAEFLDMEPADIDVGLEDDEISALLEEMPEDGVQVFETVHETRDGERVPVEISSSLITYQGETAILSIARDISDRREREAALRRTMRAVEAAGHAIYITDTDGRIEYVNPAFEEITGYDSEAAIGQTPSILKSGEMPAGYAEDLWDTILAGDVWEEELINRRKDGALYHVHQTISPVRTDDGEIDGFVAIQTDVTDRKVLDRQQRRYKQAIEGSAELFAGLDRDWQFLFTNETYREFHGFDANEDLRGRDLWSVLDEAEADAITDRLSRAMDGSTVQFTTTRTHPDRGPRLLDVLYHPIRDAEGAVRGVVGSMRDITDWRQDSRRLETLIGNLPGIVYRCQNTHGWPMEFVGGRCVEITGYPASKLESTEILWGEDVIHPDDCSWVADETEAAIAAGESFEVTYRIRTANDEIRWVWEQGRQVSTVTDDEPMLEGFIMDVTERKRREAELRQQSRAMDEAPIGITITDPSRDDNPLIYVNSGFERLTGYSESESLDRNCRFLQGEHTDPETVARIRRAIDAAEPVSVVVRNYRADGTEFWNSLDIAPVRDGDGTVTNYIGFQQDVTERVERQQQLQRIDHILRHNVRNDMTVIMGMADEIRIDGSAGVAASAEAILDRSESLLDKIDKERDIVQLLEDEPTLETVDVVSLLDADVPTLRGAYPDATIAVTGDESALARGTAKLEVALHELVENAIQHNDRDSPTVTVDVTTDPDAVTVDIADDGPGIPEMERKLLTGEEEDTPLYHGDGLGLWLVSLIVRRCGGRMSFSENDPRGSVVHLTLSRPDA